MIKLPLNGGIISCFPTPHLRYYSEILHYLLKNKLIDGNNLTVTGLTLGENLERWVHKHGELSFTEQDVIRPLEKPIKETGHLRYVAKACFSTVD